MVFSNPFSSGALFYVRVHFDPSHSYLVNKHIWVCGKFFWAI